jgi:type II secretory pathway predicted ATPase ExeA
MKRAPTRQQIERRAYEIYVQRGYHNGSDLANWTAAETELTSDLQGETAAPSRDHQQDYSAVRMFLDFYGLREQPFGMTPDPAYLWASETHREALSSLNFGIKENRGFLALIAEPGMGKTTLLYQLLEDLRECARTVFVFQSQCDSREFFQYVLYELGVDTQGMDLVAMHSTLNQLLFEEMLAGRHFVLVVDEAQNLDESVLETVRMLSNFETHHSKLLQIVLAGQPRLAATLALPQLSQLRQRIAVLSHLEPFNESQTNLYIEHRLRVARYRGERLFAKDAVELIAQQSQGIPRNINNICYQSMLIAHARGRRTVTSEIVQEAVVHLDIGSLASGLAAARSVASPPQARSQHAPKIDLPSIGGALFEKNRMGWPFRVLAFAGVCLLGSLLPSLLERAEPARVTAAAPLNSSSNARLWFASANSSKPPTYSAEPQDIGSGQVLTVVARPGQTLKELSLLYVGHFDNDLFDQICGLNPELKDPDHIEAGQLIRVPLPPGKLRKATVTPEAASASTPAKAASLLTKIARFLALEN